MRTVTAWPGQRKPGAQNVLVENMRTAINMAWEHGGADFQSRFDKSTGQVQDMKRERFAFYDSTMTKVRGKLGGNLFKH